jgi:HAD superfamily hydrolase (TIGR01509 family)
MAQRRHKSAASSLAKRDLIIFDCDGVLVDSEVKSCSVLIDCLRRQGIDMDLDTAIDTFVGRSMQALVEYCALRGRHLPHDFFRELRSAVHAAFEGGLEPTPGVATVLRKLRTPYCVASSSELERIEHSLRITGLAEVVGDKIFSASMVANGKPAPDLFLHAAASMGAAPQNTLVVEDSVSGVQAAKAAGMTVWGFLGGSHYARRDGRALLAAAGADRVFASMGAFDYAAAERIDGRVG